VAEKHIAGSGLHWFVRRGSAVRGPFSSTRIRHYVLEGRLGLDDEVSPDRADWRRLGSVDEVVPLQMREGDDSVAERQAQWRRGERLRAWRAILVALVVVGGLVALVLLAGGDREQVAADCAAPAAPGVSWPACHKPGVDLRGAILAEARLANAVLAQARLAGADLHGADLRYADLGGADLSYGNLRGAVLKGADLSNADLTNADLRGADLGFANLGGARVGGAVFEGARFDSAIWVDGRDCAAGGCPR
jgi:hypothetical protein